MSDFLKHECGIAAVRLRKPLAYYYDRYGTCLWGLNKLLLGGCFLREAPEGAIGSDRRAGKWGLRGKRGRKRCFGVSVGGVSVRKITVRAGNRLTLEISR